MEIPEDLRRLYKTVWEISQKTLINLARARSPFVCQSQSLNVYMAEPSFSQMTSMHFYAWEQGLKTGQYYLRSKAARDAIKFTLDVESLIQTNQGMFEHMNKENKSQADMRRKRKRPDPTASVDASSKNSTLSEVTTSKDNATKLCPFNPDGDDECDACSA